MASEHFVHVLLFECPTCHRPLAAAHSSPAQNFEDVDVADVDLMCKCGWNGLSSATHAKRHWVAPWVSGASDGG
jgi:hypothetical protein